MKGTYTSDVHDCKLLSRFGAIAWKQNLPPGSSVSLQLRSGNVGEPDETWSEWSEPIVDHENGRTKAPAARFVQYRATLETNDPSLARIHRSQHEISNDQPRPEVSKIDVPDLAEGDGATRQAKLSIRWDAGDPNGDDLSFDVFIRKEGWPAWIGVSKNRSATKHMLGTRQPFPTARTAFASSPAIACPTRPAKRFKESERPRRS